MGSLGERAGADIAIIPAGTVINGNVDISGKLEMHGEINGNINSDDRVNINGNVVGNIKANDLYAKDSFIEGKIECEQGAVVRENTVILGDISSDSLMIDGAIQGKIDVKGCITVGEKAIIDSDIKAKAIQVSNGAAINGHCSLCYANLNLDDVFPKTEEKPPKTDEAEKPKAVAKNKRG